MHYLDLRRCLRHLLKEKRGTVAAFTAMTAVSLTGLIGLGADTAVWYSNRHRVQIIVESAALSAGRLLSSSTQTSGSITSAANNDGLLNGYKTTTDTMSVTFAPSPPPSATSITVSVTRKLPLMFSAFFLRAQPSVTQTATATLQGGGNNACIYVLDPTSSQTLLVNSNFGLSAPSCEIDVASTSSSAAIFNSGSTLSVAKTCVAGQVINNGGTVGGLQTGCTVQSNPYKNTLPAPTLGTCINGTNYTGTVNLSPGTYCGNFNFNGSGTVNLAAGTYVFNGTNWNINSGWTINGTGVTLYFVNSASYVQFNSGVTVSLTAPTSGTYANVLMFEPDGLPTSGFAIDGSSASGHALQGLVYLPSRNITFNSTYSGTADSFALVVNQLIFDSNSPKSWSISPIGGGTTGSSIVLTN